jgi:hypothetical protein
MSYLQKLFIISLVYYGCVPESSASEPVVPYDRAINVVLSIEQSLRKCIWNAKTSYGTISKVGNNYSYAPTSKLIFDFKIHADSKAGKYRCDANTLEEWADGRSAFIGHQYMKSFDGNVERNYDRSSGSDRLPIAGDPPGQAEIDNEKDGKFMKEWGAPSGLSYCPPYFAGHKVSSLMKATKASQGDVYVRELTPTTWLIRIQDPREPLMAYELTYDLSKCGLVTKAKSEAVKNPNGVVYAQYSTTVIESPSDTYILKQIQLDRTLDGRYFRVDFTDFKYGENFDDSIYQIPYPPLTRVIDKINKKFYVVGGGAVSDRDQAREFINREGLVVSEDEWQHESSGKKWKIGLGVLSLFTFSIFVILALRWRAKRRRLLLTGLILLLLTTTANANASEFDKLTTAEHNRRVQISQCGYNAVVFALEYCGVQDYNPQTLCNIFDVSDNGIAFHQLRDAIQSYGLTADIRQDVSFDELIPILGAKRLAILPIRQPNNTNHYVIVIKHPKRGLVFIDPPQVALNLDEHPELRRRMIESWKLLKSAALIVRADEKSLATRGNPIPAISTSSLSVGDIKFENSPTYKHLACEISNTGSSAMAISAIHVPCGCISTDWTTGLIPAGGAKKLNISVDISKWSSPDSHVAVKSLKIDIIRHESLRLNITAGNLQSSKSRTVIDSNIHRIKLSSKISNRINVTSTLSNNDTTPKANYVVDSHSTWIQVLAAPPKNNSVMVSMTVPAQSLPLSTDEDILQGCVQIRDTTTSNLYKIQVLIDRSFELSSDYPVYYLSTQSETCEAILKVPNMPELDIAQIELSPHDYISATITARDKMTGVLKIAFRKLDKLSPAKGLHTISLTYPTEYGKLVSRIRVVVR